MEPTRSAYFLLRKHLLYFDASRVAKSSSNAPAQSQMGSTAVHTGATASSGLFGGHHNNNESLNFILQHAACIHKFEAQLAGQKPITTAAAGGGGHRSTSTVEPQYKSPLGTEVEYAAYCLSKSAERFPSPMMSLLDLIRAIVLHMSYHRQREGAVAGDYIIRALTYFFGVDKAEAHGRYAAALLECTCLKFAGSRGGGGAAAGGGNLNGSTGGSLMSLGEFERSYFLVQAPSVVSDLSRVINFRESGSRLLCLYSTRAVQDGANELLYLSHSRWLFGPPPEQEAGGSPQARSVYDDVDSPFSPFPERFRRGVLGPLFQYVGSFCVSECRMLESLEDQCAIVRLDGVKFAVTQLCASNVPPLIHDADSGKMARCDAPVTMLLGFPEHMADNVIHMGVKKLLDAVELCAGPRRLLGSGRTPEEFRSFLRHLGAKLFSICTEIFFRPEMPDSVYIDHQRLAWSPHSPPGTPLEKQTVGDTLRELGGLLDNGIDDQMAMLQRIKRPYNGFPTRVPYALNHRASTHALSRRACSAATQILLSVRDACSEFGGCVCSAMFFHGALIIADCHPYVAAMLGLRVRWSFFEASTPNTNNEEGGEGAGAAFTASSSAVHARSSELWTGCPAREQMPTGIFADSVFGEPFSSGASAAHGCPAASSPTSPFPRSPRASDTASPKESRQSETPTPLESADDDTAMMVVAALHPYLFPMTCYLSDELARLLPKPTTCPREAKGKPTDASNSENSPNKTRQKYECSDDTSVDGGTEYLSPGEYRAVHLSSSGIDIVLVLPVLASSSSSTETAITNPLASDNRGTTDIGEAITARFRSELSTITREMNSLSAHMSRSDSILREVEGSTNAGDDEGASVHVDPNAVMAVAGKGSSSPPTAHNQATTNPSRDAGGAATSALYLVHDLALGVGEFLDGPLGNQEETPIHKRVVPSAVLLNRANVFLRETNVAAQLLGTSLRLPRRHPDDAESSDPPFSVEPTTRVILGRSSFSEKDRKGPHSVIYSRQSGGQQAFFGVPTASTQSVTLRNVEDMYVQFVSSSRSHTVVI